MPFDPTLPVNHAEVSSAELRAQFNGLKDLIDDVPAPVPETDPVSLHLDQSTPQTVTGGAPVFADGLEIPVSFRFRNIQINDLSVMGGTSDAHLLTTTGNAESLFYNGVPLGQVIGGAAPYTPANSNHWADPPPATLAEALDRLAAAVSSNGANPV